MIGPRRALTASTAAALLLAACSDAPRPSDPRLTTLFDVQALYAAGKDATYALAPDTGVPGGQPIGRVADNGGTLTVTIDWAEGYDAEVVTTDVWAHFPEVWIQPAYVPATGWKDGAPPGTDLASKLADAGIPNNATYMAPPNDDPNILGRVTLDPSCFATDPDPGDAFCTYLDSQSRIEMYVPRAAIHATEMTLNCPVVSAKGNPAVP